MAATAEDLPWEMLCTIAEILSGKNIETFGDGADGNPLELTKRELSACALTCRHWAKVLRPKLFEDLTLSTSRDGEMFHSFVIAPYHPDTSIAPHVRRLTLRYTVTHTPWLHLVFMCRDPLSNLSSLKVCLQGAGKTTHATLRSIHQGLPRSFPPSLSYIDTLELQDLTFATFADLNSTLRSAPVLFVSAGVARMPSQAYGPMMPGNIILRNIHVTHPDELPHLRPFELKLNDNIMFYVQDCSTPWRSLRALVPTQPRAASKRWYPFVQPLALHALEKLSSAIIQTCPLYRDEKGNVTVVNHDHPLKFYFEFRHEPTNHGFTLYTREWCSEGGIEEIHATIFEGGLLSRIDITVSHHERARDVPWRAIDEDMWALVPNIGAFVLEMSAFGYDLKSPFLDFAKIVYREMPRLHRADILQFWDSSDDNLPAFRVYPDV